MFKKTSFLSLMILMGVAFTMSTAHGRTDADKKVINMFEAKCMKDSVLALDASKSLCQCISSELLKKVTVADLSRLSQPVVELSEEEAAKVENVDEDMYTLRDLEYNIAVACMKKHKAKKKNNLSESK